MSACGAYAMPRTRHYYGFGHPVERCRFHPLSTEVESVWNPALISLCPLRRAASAAASQRQQPPSGGAPASRCFGGRPRAQMGTGPSSSASATYGPRIVLVTIDHKEGSSVVTKERACGPFLCSSVLTFLVVNASSSCRGPAASPRDKLRACGAQASSVRSLVITKTLAWRREPLLFLEDHTFVAGRRCRRCVRHSSSVVSRSSLPPPSSSFLTPLLPLSVAGEVPQ